MGDAHIKNIVYNSYVDKISARAGEGVLSMPGSSGREGAIYEKKISICGKARKARYGDAS